MRKFSLKFFVMLSAFFILTLLILVPTQIPARFSDYEVVTKYFKIPNNAEFNETVYCPASKRVLGGGYRILDGITSGVFVRTNSLDFKGREGWAVRMHNRSGINGLRIEIKAICACID